MSRHPCSISLALISKYRASLMGFAMLFIILFHIPLLRASQFYGLYRMGNVGVDMFLFLSGIGLWYAWNKKPSYLYFLKRRCIRIYPVWFVLALNFYLLNYYTQQTLTHSLTDLIGDVLINWDFWLQGELTFWYIPATMMLYLFAPAYIQLINKYPVYRWLPVLMIVWCIMVQWIAPLYHYFIHLEIFWSRVPIFFIGINFGLPIQNRKVLQPQAFWLIFITFALTLGTSVYLEQQLHGRFPLFVERMIYIPMTISGIILLCMVLRKLSNISNSIVAASAWIGGLSLEVYLLHTHFILKYLVKWHCGYWLTALLCLIITLPIAWILHKGVAWAVNKIVK